MTLIPGARSGKLTKPSSKKRCQIFQKSHQHPLGEIGHIYVGVPCELSGLVGMNFLTQKGTETKTRKTVVMVMVR